MDENFNLKGNKEIEEALKEFEAKSNATKQEHKISAKSSGVGESLDLKEKIGIQDVLREFETQPNKVEQQEIKTTENEENLSLGRNIKIEDSIKEFEEKYNKEQLQKKIIKTEETYRSSNLVQFVIKYSGGLIKNEIQAEYVLLGIATTIFLVSGYLFYLGIRGSKPSNQPIPPEILRQLEQMRKK